MRQEVLYSRDKRRVRRTPEHGRGIWPATVHSEGKEHIEELPPDPSRHVVLVLPGDDRHFPKQRRRGDSDGRPDR